jgi:transcription antitermination factor NusG
LRVWEKAVREARARQAAEALTAGEAIEVTDGPWKGFHGVVVAAAAVGEIEIDLATFGRAQRIKLRASAVGPGGRVAE